MSNAAETRAGVLHAIAAFALWGVAPIYFKAVAHIGAGEILAHRVLWSVVLLAPLLLILRRMDALRAILRSPRLLATLLCTALVVGLNWLVFIWAVGAGHVLECSLGYFINPLVNVLLGVLFLGERLGRWQVVAVALAAVSVAYQAFGIGHVPTIALTLAFSFALYGLLRKLIKVAPIEGLLVETCLLLPLAVVAIAYFGATGQGAFLSGSASDDLLLVGAGLVTALPLLFFAAAAPRLSLTSLGFLQYIAPTGHFLLAVFLYGETFDFERGVTFAGIWLALFIFSTDAWFRSRRARRVDSITPWVAVR